MPGDECGLGLRAFRGVRAIRLAGDECGLGLKVFRVKGLGEYAWLGMSAVKGLRLLALRV